MERKKTNDEHVVEMFTRLTYLFLGILLSFVFIFSGSTLNSIVVTENGGKMPVYAPGFNYETDRHFSISSLEEIKKPMLADIHSIMPTRTLSLYYSIGDVLLVAGALMSLIFASLITIQAYKINKFSKKNYGKKVIFV